jgi:hypothetical protein
MSWRRRSTHSAASLLREARWRSEAYEFVRDVPAFDLLAGTAAVRQAIESGAEFEDVARLLDGAAPAFLARRAPHLIYG